MRIIIKNLLIITIIITGCTKYNANNHNMISTNKNCSIKPIRYNYKSSSYLRSNKGTLATLFKYVLLSALFFENIKAQSIDCCATIESDPNFCSDLIRWSI